MSTWGDAQEWEKSWWGDCVNTLNEEQKQITYASHMGIPMIGSAKTQYVYDGGGRTILDMGGGPVSLLLKVVNSPKRVVVDPIQYPDWVYRRYDAAGIYYSIMKGEDVRTDEKFDEVWMYNCLQHTDDPHAIVSRIREIGTTIRVFEWVETSKNIGHPHVLQEGGLNAMFDGYGKVQTLRGEHGCHGKCYYGIFNGIR